MHEQSYRMSMDKCLSSHKMQVDSNSILWAAQAFTGEQQRTLALFFEFETLSRYKQRVGLATTYMHKDTISMEQTWQDLKLKPTNSFGYAFREEQTKTNL